MESHLRGEGGDQPCREVVLHQWKYVKDGDQPRRWKREHHAPEPWLGHFGEAPILFVSSNPNLSKNDLRRATLAGEIPEPVPLPKLGAAELEDHASLGKPFRAAKPYWRDVEVVDVFDNMFDVWVTEDGVRRRLENGGASRVPYWEFVRAQAQILLGDVNVLPGRHYAITEVVHCKSASEGYVESALPACVDRYLEAVLEASAASVIFVVGAHAARALKLIAPELRSSELAPDVKAGRPGRCVRAEVGKRERLLAYVPHPSWLRRHPESRQRYELPDAFGSEALAELRCAVRVAMGSNVPEVRLTGAGGAAITTVKEWRRYAPPKGGDVHWVDGRSAKELAKAWCGLGDVCVPADFRRLLNSHDCTRGIRLVDGYPEWKTGLRGEQRGPRVHDLLLVGEVGDRKVVVGVEAKADETFGGTASEGWAAAQATLAREEATNWPTRLARLIRALLGVEAVSEDGTLNPEVVDVPYQLVTALAGTLIEAEGREADLAVLAVHVFATAQTQEAVIAENKQAFAKFAERVTGTRAADIADGQLYGPFCVPGGGGIPRGPALIGVVTSHNR